MISIVLLFVCCHSLGVYQYPKKLILLMLPHQLPEWNSKMNYYLQTYLDYYSLLNTMSGMFPFKPEVTLTFPDFYSQIQISETQTFLNQVQRVSIPSIIISNQSNTTQLLENIVSFEHKLKSYQFAVSLTKTLRGNCLGYCSNQDLKGLSDSIQSLQQDISPFNGVVALDYRTFIKSQIDLTLSDVFVNFYEATDQTLQIVFSLAKRYNSSSVSFDISEFGNSMYFQNCAFLGNVLNKAFKENLNVSFIVNRSHWLESENSQLFVKFLEMFKTCMDSFDLIIV